MSLCRLEGMMNVRLANSQDLLPLELMYQSIVKQMEQEGLAIWDDVYPCICFPQDVKKQELYVIREGRTYISAFVLSEAHEGQEDIMWGYPQARAFYIDRFGVNVAVRAKGMGMYTLQEAVKEVKKRGGDSLRLFVVAHNQKAIHLYEKFGFQRAHGVYHEVIDDNLTLIEYGYELNINDHMKEKLSRI